MEPILEFKNIVKAFPGVLALDHVCLSFMPGEVHALAGENGAGKSTLIKTLSGVNTPDEGEIHFMGKVYKGFTPSQSRKLGIEIMYQELSLVSELTVAENIFLGNAPRKSGLFLDKKGMLRKSKEIFEQMEIDIDPNTLVRDLTVGYQQMVELARAVNAEAKLLVLDEPTAPLSAKETEILFKFIAAAKKKGITIIYISHRLDEIFSITDRLSVLRDGKWIATKNTNETNRNELISLMVGREVKELFAKRPPVNASNIILETQNLSGNGVKDISLCVYKGEILGLGGLVGAGRTEFAELLYGAKKIDSGTILLEGKPIAPQNPGKAMRYGITLCPEDRKQKGLLLEMSVAENTSMSVLKRLSKASFLDKKREAKMVNEYKDRLRIKTARLSQSVKNLSGGNQQKVVVAKSLASDPKIVIFDEPTRGIDVGAKQEIYSLMNDLVASGMTVIMISSDMEELLGMSDRIGVFCEGRIKGIIQRKEFKAETVLKFASPSTFGEE